MITNYFFFPRPVSSRVQAGASQTKERQGRWALPTSERYQYESSILTCTSTSIPDSAVPLQALPPASGVRACAAYCFGAYHTGRPDCKLPSISQVISLRTADGMGGDFGLVQSVHAQ